MPKTIFTRTFCVATNTIIMTTSASGSRCAFRAHVPASPMAVLRRLIETPVFDFTHEVA